MANERLTFEMDDCRISKCACGSTDLHFVEAEFSTSYSRYYCLACKACGYVMTGQAVNMKEVKYFRKNWNNAQKERREAQNGNTAE